MKRQEKTMGFDGRKPGDNPALDEIERLQSELDAERERADTLHKAQPYLYIGKNGKTILARNLEDQRDAALANVAKLREALEFYASERTYQSSTVYMCGHSGDSKIETDGGRRARAVLAETGGEDE